MNLTELFIAELKQEGETTRRVLSRVPETQMSWKPHPKSMSLGELAYHVASVPQGVATMLATEAGSPPRGPRTEATSVEQLVAKLDESLAFATAKLGEWGDDGLRARWQMLAGDRPVFDLPRAGMVRSAMLNHWYHHRGQLTVYLRMLDIALPSIYGPTADESPFG